MKKFKYLDYYIFIPYLVLSIIGILMVYSASSYIAISQYDDSQRYFIRQAFFVFLGLVTSMVVFLFKYKLLKNKRFLIVASGLVALLLLYLFFFGKVTNGAKGWIFILGFGFQPAEFAKIVVIWYFAYIFSKKQNQLVHNFKETVTPPLTLFGFYLLLILLQPDVGGAAILLVTGTIMILASGVSTKLAAAVGTIGIALIGGILALVRTFGMSLPLIEKYQYDRFLAFWDPFAVSESAGLQLVNSYYALRRGGLFGVGIGESIQKTGYLPEPYTDFIMSIIGEEMGLLGILVIVGLFGLLILRIYLVGIRAKDSFGALICIGIATMLLVQGLVNLGGVIGLMPITGVTFPFISYGGSSTIVLTISIGLVLNVSAADKKNDN
ncbi:cell division-specific peptidoglycan biosynthesis regulator FtsW [Carnobacterium alterfunditum]|uniref:Probable peptidoglycan glycosyltransferase FtsW n=1 Tax=Carnobacterium alterfunditum TaxID=28230 RepID=A0A1N6GNW7_9LACT|nr:FtsW/RodA/SpoVE family cell cycle protein [Carnobacterium alterfunditum]SIO09259.1 cell division-specific peptidoglycan biosynthesis regulator FtsW [Carnobacterium alterfunditum]